MSEMTRTRGTLKAWTGREGTVTVEGADLIIRWEYRDPKQSSSPRPDATIDTRVIEVPWASNPGRESEKGKMMAYDWRVVT